MDLKGLWRKGEDSGLWEASSALSHEGVGCGKAFTVLLLTKLFFLPMPKRLAVAALLACYAKSSDSAGNEHVETVF